MSRLGTLVQFLLIGALLFVGDRWLGAGGEPERIVLSSGRIEALRGELAERSGSEPSESELDLAIERFVVEEILFREALALGLEHEDAVVAQRLVRNLRFLGAPPESSDAELLREAFALRLERSDLVVRRRLVERMRQVLATRVTDREIPNAELHALYERDSAKLSRPARVQLRHVFLSRERRGEARLADARRLHGRLLAEPISPRDAIALADPFLPGHVFASVSQDELAADFGPAFAREAFSLAPTGRWSPAIESVYGSHLVYIESLRPARVPSFEQALPQLRASWLAQRERVELRAALARLRPTYRVVHEAGS